MRSILLHEMTGGKANNLKIARRLAQKIQRAQEMGNCLLINCEKVELSRDFLNIVMAHARPDKIKFSGLPRDLQIKLNAQLEKRGCK